MALLVLGFILPGAAQMPSGIPIQPGFDYKKLEGLWQRLALVAQGQEPIILGPEIQVFPLRKGDLSVGRNIVVRLTCRFIDFRYRNTGRSGVFNVFHTNGDLSTVHVVDTDYSDYLVLHTETAGECSLSLYARGTEMSDRMKKKFEDYVRSLGFSKADIKYQGKDDQCPLSQPTLENHP
ncbi:lipocalin-15 [Anolis sagrei]|uniref:lipocalin-15 n=1 Tax=Anolis sagrei TaxID=38937 RepID=UPI0035219DBE